VETALAEIWATVLGVERVGRRDDFFTLGGHSLLAIRVAARAQEVLGVELTIRAIFESPSIAQLAAEVDQIRRGGHSAGVVEGETRQVRRSPLTLIRPGVGRRPLFLVHPADGAVFCYMQLSRQLAGHDPIYGLSDPWLTDGIPADVSINEMAACYVEALNTAWPEGICNLGGWSFGGLVAYEMAQQLRRSGREVGSLLLLDTPAPGFARDIVMEDHVALAALARDRASFFGREFTLTSSHLRELDDVERPLRVLEELKAARLLPPHATVDAVERPLRLLKIREAIRNLYAPQPYDGRITLFHAVTLDADLMTSIPGIQKMRADDPTLGWGGLAMAGVDVRFVSGTHASLAVEPNVQALASVMRECLAE
jgi:thioesterase domain-containing protein